MKKNFFSLVELLVVIVIIAILAGLAFPMFGKIRAKAKVTQAKSDITAITTALKQFESTYSSFNCINNLFTNEKIKDDASYKELIKTLTNAKKSDGTKDYTPSYNSRGVKFLDAHKNDWKDPWGQNYIILVCTDFDGQVEINSSEKNCTVFVYSAGLDKKDSNGVNDFEKTGKADDPDDITL